MNFIYLFFKLLKTNNKKITFLSRQSNNLSIDIKLISDELKKNDKDIKIIFLCKRFDNIKKNFLSYGLYTLKTMYHISTSKVCITDSYSLPISILKHKKSLKVMQIWHAMGAIKKFGYQTVGKVSGRSELISNGLKMHNNYDYIISGSSSMTKYFSKAFGYDESYFLNYGLPRIDYLINYKDKLKKAIINKYPAFRKKINILYAPTFRTTHDDKTLDLIKIIDFSKYNLIIKQHENQKFNIDNEFVFICDDFSALELLTISDYLITDYSAIAIEAASIDVKTYYYVFDYEKYQENNGLNIDLYKEMPGCCFKDAAKLVESIEKDNYDMSILKKYKDKYIDVQNGTSTKKIVKQIVNWM